MRPKTSKEINMRSKNKFKKNNFLGEDQDHIYQIIITQVIQIMIMIMIFNIIIINRKIIISIIAIMIVVMEGVVIVEERMIFLMSLKLASIEMTIYFLIFY